MVRCTEIQQINERPSLVVVSPIVVPDWTVLRETEPYLKDDNYFIAVSTDSETMGTGAERSRIIAKTKKRAAKFLLEAYSKSEDDQYLNQAESRLELRETYVPERPNPKECLIFPARILFAHPRMELDRIPYKSNAFDAREDVTFGTIQVSFRTSQLREEIGLAVTVFNEYAQQIDKAKVSLAGVNLRREARFIQDYIFAIERHLNANGFFLREEKEDLVQLNFNDDYELVSVVYAEDGTFGFTGVAPGKGAAVSGKLINLSIRLGEFKDTVPVNRPSTNFLMNRIQRINVERRTEDRRRPWTQWVADYLENDNPRVSIKVPDLPSVEFAGQEFRPPDRVSVRTPRVRGSVKSDSVASFRGALDAADRLSDTKLRQQKADLGVANLKGALGVNGKNLDEFVGDAIQQALFSGDAILNDLDDLYQFLLEKISIEQLIATAIRCIGFPDPCAIAKAILRALPCDQLAARINDVLGENILNDNPLVRDFILNSAVECQNEATVAQQNGFVGRLRTSGLLEIETYQDFLRLKDNLPADAVLSALEPTLRQEIFSNICDELRDDIIDAIPDRNCLDFLPLSLKIPKFSLPTLNLDIELPTIDLLAFIMVQIELGIIQALIQTLLAMIKQILVGIFEKCGDVGTLDFGEINFNGIVGLDTGLGLNIGGFDPIKASGIKGEINSILGIGLSDPENLPPADTIVQNLGGLTDDLFALISSGEFVRLLNGSPDREVIQIIGCLVDTKYPELAPVLATIPNIEHIFETLGGLVNIPAIGVLVEDRLSRLCADSDADDSRRRLLGSKNLTPEEIEEQIMNNKMRRMEQLAGLANFVQNNDLNDYIPRILCSGSQPGLVPRNPPAASFGVDRTLDTLFDPIEVSFAQEIATFPFAFSTSGTQDVGGGLKGSFESVEESTTVIRAQSSQKAVGFFIPNGGNINYRFGTQQEKNIFDFIVTTGRQTIRPPAGNPPMDNSVEALISERSLTIPQNIGAQPGYFSSFMTDLFKRDASVYVDGIKQGAFKFETGLFKNSSVADSILFRDDNSGIRGLFRNNYYYFALTDIFANVTKAASESPLFDLTTLQAVNFVDLPIDEERNVVPERAGECDSGLLRIQAVKREVKESYNKKSCDDEAAQFDPAGKEPLKNPLKSDSLEKTAEMYVKVFVAEELLKSIFVISKVYGEEPDVIAAYIGEKVNRSLAGEETDEGFARVFRKTIEDIDMNSSYTENLQNMVASIIPPMMDKIALMSGAAANPAEGSIENRFVSDWLPLFDVVEDNEKNDIRFTDTNGTKLSDFKNIEQGVAASGRPIPFELANGNFILERYIRVIDTPGTSDVFLIKTRKNSLKGIVNVGRWNSFVEGLRAVPHDPRQEFKTWRAGLRLVYLPPLSEEALSSNVKPENAVFENLYKRTPNNLQDRIVLNKSELVEELVETARSAPSISPFTVTRKIYPIPIVSVEQDIPIPTNSPSSRPSYPNMENEWRDRALSLEKQLVETAEFGFLFRYALPLNRLATLATIFAGVYVENEFPGIDPFRGTKEQIQSVMKAASIAGQFDARPDTDTKLGGHAGISKLGAASGGPPKIPGVNTDAIISRAERILENGTIRGEGFVTQDNLKATRERILRESGTDLFRSGQQLLRNCNNG